MFMSLNSQAEVVQHNLLSPHHLDVTKFKQRGHRRICHGKVKGYQKLGYGTARSLLI